MLYVYLMKQEAQLSQGDRATAAWVGFGQNITGRGYLHRILYRLAIFNHYDLIAGRPTNLSNSVKQRKIKPY